MEQGICLNDKSFQMVPDNVHCKPKVKFFGVFIKELDTKMHMTPFIVSESHTKI